MAIAHQPIPLTLVNANFAEENASDVPFGAQSDSKVTPKPTQMGFQATIASDTVIPMVLSNFKGSLAVHFSIIFLAKCAFATGHRKRFLGGRCFYELYAKTYQNGSPNWCRESPKNSLLLNELPLGCPGDPKTTKMEPTAAKMASGFQNLSFCAGHSFHNLHSDWYRNSNSSCKLV